MWLINPRKRLSRQLIDSPSASDQVVSLLVQHARHVVRTDLVLEKMRHDHALVLTVVRVVGSHVVAEVQEDPYVAR